MSTWQGGSSFLDGLLRGWTFEREPVFPFGIALLASRNQIAFGRFAAANDRNQVVHCKFSRRKLSATVVADPRGALALPPLARAQLSGLLPLGSDFLLGNFY
jgi:hypothetical protein